MTKKEELRFEYDILVFAKDIFQKSLTQMQATAYSQPDYPNIEQYIKEQEEKIDIIKKRMEPFHRAIIDIEREDRKI